MGFFEWLGLIVEAALVVIAIVAVMRLEKKRPTKSINPASDEDIDVV